MTREQAINYLISSGFSDEQVSEVVRALTYESKSYQWCTDCREYDQEKHCCNRWSKVIRDTVEEMKQESIIDKIRAEIQENINYNKKMNYQGIVAGLLLTLDIIDKYKAETEE